VKTPPSRLGFSALVLFVLVGCSIGHAGVVYEYTGNPFATVSGSTTTSQFITIALEFATPLAANLNYADVTGDVQSFLISDQVNSVSTAALVRLSTDPGGIPVAQWYIESVQVPALGTLSMTSSTSITPPQNFGDLDQTGSFTFGSGSSFVPGTWNIVGSSVPEPSTSTLLLMGAGLGLIRRWRVRKSFSASQSD
jgi:hypothetical protein